MKLVIVESPNKTKAIQEYLGDEYVVTASVGNIRDLSTKRGKHGYGIDIDNGFEGYYEIDPEKRNIVNNLRKLSKEADEVILASDPDREGEAIAWHIKQVLNMPDEKVKRALFYEITKKAILESFDNLTTINPNLVESQESRRMLDRIVGFGLSKFLQTRAFLTSAGRVQSAVLKMIVDKEREIQAFVPEEYWLLRVTFNNEDKEYTLRLNTDYLGNKKIPNKAALLDITQHLAPTLTVKDINKRAKFTEPQLPFKTSSLQQEAFNRFGFQSDRTMRVAQSLFETTDRPEGLITYFRTDTVRLKEDYIPEAQDYIASKYGQEYVRDKKLKQKLTSKQKVQNAHSAIQPTRLDNYPDEVREKYKLTDDQYKLYSLIYYRSLASLMTPSKSEVTTITFTSNGNLFTLSGEEIVEKGYRLVYEQFDRKVNPIGKEFNIGDEFKILNIDEEQKFTEPPSRYSEARIIKEMDEKGIGRPSTYALTISRLAQNNYILREGTLTPTEEGMKAIEILEKYFEPIVQYEYTANLEKSLDEISDGKLTKNDFLTEFYDDFSKKLDETFEKTKNVPLDEKCPKCGGDLIVKEGKYRPYIECLNKECNYRKSLKIEKYTGRLCPVCGEPLVYKTSKYGQFISCSDFPNCTYKRSMQRRRKSKKS